MVQEAIPLQDLTECFIPFPKKFKSVKKYSAAPGFFFSTHTLHQISLNFLYFNRHIKHTSSNRTSM